MPEWTWNYDTATGTYKSHTISSKLREQAVVESVFADFGFSSEAGDVHGGADFGGSLVCPMDLGHVVTRNNSGDNAVLKGTGNATHITRSHVSGADKGR